MKYVKTIKELENNLETIFRICSGMITMSEAEYNSHVDKFLYLVTGLVDAICYEIHGDHHSASSFSEAKNKTALFASYHE